MALLSLTVVPLPLDLLFAPPSSILRTVRALFLLCVGRSGLGWKAQICLAPPAQTPCTISPLNSKPYQTKLRLSSLVFFGCKGMKWEERPNGFSNRKIRPILIGEIPI